MLQIQKTDWKMLMNKGLGLLILALWCCAELAQAAAPPLEQLEIPKGFSIHVYAVVPRARSLTLGEDGVVFVGSRRGDKVHAVIPRNKKDFSQGGGVQVIAKGLDMPNGVTFHKGSLYVAEMSRVLRYDNIQAQLSHPPKPVELSVKLPSERHHGWRYIAVGPDKRLYVAIGAPCNVCISENPLFATIASMKLDGSDLKIFAKGVRNSVGFTWDSYGSLWFTDNGRDWLGDHLPPDELNKAEKAGLHFGFPYVYGHNVPDEDFYFRQTGGKFTPSFYDFPAHVATLGVHFYTGKRFPKPYHNQIIVARHGSWNRSSKVGYDVRILTLANDRIVSDQPLVSGWLQGQRAWGRPVDTLVLPDGSLLISDDVAGLLYRLDYTGVKDAKY